MRLQDKEIGGWHHIKTDIAWKKAAKKVITNSVTIGSVAKNLANKALNKAPVIIDSLSNRTNNKTIKKY